MRILTLLAIALLVGCATKPSPKKLGVALKQLKQYQLPKMDHLEPVQATPVERLVASPTKAMAGTNRVTMTKVPLAEAGSFGQRFNCAKSPALHGYIWVRPTFSPSDQWIFPFNAEDNGTNATSYVPCVTRGGQPPNGKYVPSMFAAFYTDNPNNLKTTDTFMTQVAAARKKLGKDAGNWGMTRDGKLVRLQ